MTTETEKVMQIYQKTIKFIVIAFAVTVIALNLIWIIFFNGYTFTSESVIVQQDGQGVNVYTDNQSQSEVNYGTDSH